MKRNPEEMREENVTHVTSHCSSAQCFQSAHRAERSSWTGARGGPSRELAFELSRSPSRGKAEDGEGDVFKREQHVPRPRGWRSVGINRFSEEAGMAGEWGVG